MNTTPAFTLTSTQSPLNPEKTIHLLSIHTLPTSFTYRIQDGDLELLELKLLDLPQDILSNPVLFHQALHKKKLTSASSHTPLLKEVSF